MIKETIALHEIMASIARCETAEREARELLEKHLTSFVPEDYDVLVEQALVVANNWRQFSEIVRKSQRNTRGHIYTVK
jgi:hypothetical protein